MAIISISLPDELLKRLDDARGDVSRSAWVRNWLQYGLEPQIEPLPDSSPPQSPYEIAEQVITDHLRRGSPSPQRSASLLLWRCGKCGWEKRGATVRACPDHGYQDIIEIGS